MLGLIVVSPPSALGQALDIDQPEITKGERELRSVNVVNGGLPDGSPGASRSSHEVSASYSPSDWVKLTAHLDAENALHGDWRLDHGAIELQFELLKAGATGGIALGWLTNLQVSTDPQSTNSLIFGPIIKVSSKTASFTSNLYFEDTFGRNRDPGLRALYGWQGRVEVSDDLGLGIEGYGAIDNISDAPPASEQDHRIGPAAYFSSNLDGDRTFSVDVAVLFGLTEAAPNSSLKFNFGMTF
jgi:hypothetical protein